MSIIIIKERGRNMYYNFFTLVGVLEEIFKDGYIRLNVNKERFIVKLDKCIERPNKDYIGKTISVKGQMHMTNIIELIGERIVY